MHDYKSTFLTTHEARAQLEARYPAMDYPSFDAYLVTFDSYGFRTHLHRELAELPAHDPAKLCYICLTLGELCALHITPLLQQKVLDHIASTFTPNSKMSSLTERRQIWLNRIAELQHEISVAIVDEVGVKLQVSRPLAQTYADKAAYTCTQRWIGKLMTRNMGTIHAAFNWHCPVSHPSSD